MDPRWIFLFAGVYIVHTHGSCFWNHLVDIDGLMPYCVGRDIDEVFMLGEQKVTEDCFNCSCSLSGLYCCGLGPYNRGSMRLAPGCEIVPREKCKFSIVCEDDEQP